MEFLFIGALVVLVIFFLPRLLKFMAKTIFVLIIVAVVAAVLLHRYVF